LHIVPDGNNRYTKWSLSIVFIQSIDIIICKGVFYDNSRTISTSQTITDISGRRVGLASILAELNRLNGSIYINNKFRKGIEYEKDFNSR